MCTSELVLDTYQMVILQKSQGADMNVKMVFSIAAGMSLYCVHVPSAHMYLSYTRPLLYTFVVLHTCPSCAVQTHHIPACCMSPSAHTSSAALVTHCCPRHLLHAYRTAARKLIHQIICHHTGRSISRQVWEDIPRAYCCNATITAAVATVRKQSLQQYSLMHLHVTAISLLYNLRIET